MPARDFVEKFTFDPSTFQYDDFKTKLLSELSSDDDLTTAKITQLTDTNATLTESEKGLKLRLFDATIGKQGNPVAPTDSPANAGATGTAPVVPDTDIFQ